MPSEVDDFAPYAPPANVIAIIRQQHKRGLPDVIDKEFLVRMGVSPALATRVLQAVRFLGLVEDDGRQTEEFRRLKRVAEDDYPDYLAELLRSAYQKIFEVVDISSTDERALHDAFRYFEPSGQRVRMVTLFSGLCREAGLINDGVSPRSTPIRRPSTKKHVQATTQRKSSLKPEERQDKTINLTENDEEVKNDRGKRQESGGIRYPVLNALLNQLPANEKWTTKRRNQWIAAFTASVDLIVDVEEVEEKQPQTKLEL
jgi:hypothetical protein